jgi:ABC-2 type transport system permease protein
LLRTTLQPLLVVFVFGFLLPRMGFMKGGYGGALLPGVLAISLTLSSVMSVALPMVSDFGITGEIEDRLLAPIPLEFVAAEKVVGGIVQGLIAALFLLPVARLIMGPVAGLSVESFGLVILLTMLGAAAFSTFGLWLGTAISPQQIGLMFGVFLTPLIFFGCAYYPWQGLSVLPVMKYLVLLNPLVYVSEGMRAAITPTLPHMPLALVLTALVAITAIFWVLGMRTFRKRALG